VSKVDTLDFLLLMLQSMLRNSPLYAYSLEAKDDPHHRHDGGGKPRAAIRYESPRKDAFVPARPRHKSGAFKKVPGIML